MKLIKDLIAKYLKIWGVKFEFDLPPEFVITEHATQRVKERVGTQDPIKIKKLCIKAWYSEQPKIHSQTWYRKDYMKQFRGIDPKFIIIKECMGYIFIYRLFHNRRYPLRPQKVLLTVLK